jgi:DNA-directed RNA polymerase subunit RPC12/RpoP
MQLTEPQKSNSQRYVAPRRPVRAKLPCFLCSADLEIRTDKNGKRYFICDDCGVQAFIRRKTGISKLAKLVRQFKKAKSTNAPGKKSPFEFSVILTEIEELKKQIKKLKTKTGLFSADRDSKRIAKALQERVNALLSILEKQTKNRQPISKTKNIS